MQNSRSKNVALNATWAIISQVTIVFLGLINRKVFLDSLGAELLGVNSLFSDVLMLFSFADLGLGTAIMFSMYKPIADEDTEKISALLLFYKKIYRYVIGVLIFISLGFVPFLSIIKTTLEINDLRCYYLFFQITNISEYIWAYRESYIIACQNERVISVFDLIYNLAKNILQIILVVVYKNFILYLLMGVACVLLKKVCLNVYIVDKYPITTLYGATELKDEEKKKVLSKSWALLVTKIGNLIINQTDSLIVSYIINVTQWGLASNYLMIKKSVFVVTDKIYSAVLPSMGNLVAEHDKERETKTFLLYDFLNSWLHTFCFIALTCLSSQFIVLFFGKNVLLPNSFVFIFFLAAFIDGLRAPVSVMREANGTFEKDKWYTIVSAVVNVVVSVPLAKMMGLSGVYLGTICAMVVLHICRTLVLLGSGEYNITATQYFDLILKHIVLGLLLYFGTYMVILRFSTLVNNEYGLFFLECLIVVIVPNVSWVILHFRNEFFCEFMKKIVKR